MRIVAAAFMAASFLAGCDTNSPAATEARAERYANEAERRATFMAADWSPIKTALLTCAEYTRNGAPSPEVLKAKGFSERGRNTLKGTFDGNIFIGVEWGLKASLLGENGCIFYTTSPDYETHRVIYSYTIDQLKAAGYKEVAATSRLTGVRSFEKGGKVISVIGGAQGLLNRVNFFQ